MLPPSCTAISTSCQIWQLCTRPRRFCWGCRAELAEVALDANDNIPPSPPPPSSHPRFGFPLFLIATLKHLPLDSHSLETTTPYQPDWSFVISQAAVVLIFSFIMPSYMRIARWSQSVGLPLSCWKPPSIYLARSPGCIATYHPSFGKRSSRHQRHKL